MNLKIKRLRPGAHLPGRATAGAAGMDLRACCGKDGITLAPMERTLIPIGIAVELPANTVGLVFARSGLALREGLTMANGVGVVDSDYRGELSIPMVNLSAKALHIANGQRVAQLVVTPIVPTDMIEIDDLSDTQRGVGGFGSTGVL